MLLPRYSIRPHFKVKRKSCVVNDVFFRFFLSLLFKLAAQADWIGWRDNRRWEVKMQSLVFLLTIDFFLFNILMNAFAFARHWSHKQHQWTNKKNWNIYMQSIRNRNEHKYFIFDGGNRITDLINIFFQWNWHDSQTTYFLGTRFKMQSMHLLWNYILFAIHFLFTK